MFIEPTREHVRQRINRSNPRAQWFGLGKHGFIRLRICGQRRQSGHWSTAFASRMIDFGTSVSLDRRLLQCATAVGVELDYQPSTTSAESVSRAWPGDIDTTSHTSYNAAGVTKLRPTEAPLLQHRARLGTTTRPSAMLTLGNRELCRSPVRRFSVLSSFYISSNIYP